MTRPSIHIQIAPTSVPSTPAWLGEMAVLAHVLSHRGLQKAIEERVQFARARMGDYEVIDFVVMLMGYAVSGESTIKAFYERLLPFAEPFMALFGRAKLPHRGTLSRFLLTGCATRCAFVRIGSGPAFSDVPHFCHGTMSKQLEASWRYG